MKMTEQRVNAQGETVEFNEDSQRWEPVNNDEAKAEEPKAELDDTEEFDVDNDEDEGKPVSFDYTPRTDK
jgi:hypothetical protein